MQGSSDGPVACIDIGGTSTKIGVFDGEHEAEIVHSLPTLGPADQFVEAVAAAVLARVSLANCRALGVAVAGFLDESCSAMIYNSNLPWLEKYPLRQHLQDRLAVPVLLEVDSNAAAIAEHRLGTGNGSQRFLCVTIGTGYGVGMIVDGAPLRFAYGCMGDAGHMVIAPEGPECGCGGRGCAEMLVSAPFLAETYRVLKGVPAVRGLREVIEAARAGDQDARDVLTRAGKWLGISLATLANTYFPDRIAIAGGLAEAGDVVLDSVRTHFDRSASTFARNQTSIERARLGSKATLTGAGLLSC